MAAVRASDVTGPVGVDLDPHPDAAEAEAVGRRGAQWEARVVAIARKLDLGERLVGVAIGGHPSGRGAQGADGHQARRNEQSKGFRGTH